jgi:hypothetical protein
MLGRKFHPLPALHKMAKIDQPIHIHPEVGSCNVCQNVGQLPILDVAYAQKQKFYVEY